MVLVVDFTGQLIVADFKDVKTNYDKKGELVQWKCLFAVLTPKAFAKPMVRVARYIGLA